MPGLSTGSRTGCRFAFKGVRWYGETVFIGFLLSGVGLLGWLVVVVGLGCFSSFSQPDGHEVLADAGDCYGYGEPGCDDDCAEFYGECD